MGLGHSPRTTKSDVYILLEMQKLLKISLKLLETCKIEKKTFSAASAQAEIFPEAISVVMPLPGDLHTAMNYAQAIFNYCYQGFLDEF